MSMRSQPASLPLRLRVAVLMLCLVAPLLLTARPGNAQNIVNELEAQFIERFTQFIEWPADSTVSDTAVPFVLGVLGDSEILQPLLRLAATKKFKGKKLEVRKLADRSEISSCQAVFISESERGQLQEILGQTRSRPILTVGDTKGFAKSGIMINFTPDGQNLKFEINAETADRAGLKLASKLVSLAAQVY